MVDQIESHENTTAPKKSHLGLIIILVLIVLILGGGAVAGVTQINKANEQASQAPTITSTPVYTSQNVILYGAWVGEGSAIKAYDLSKNQSHLLTTLPQKIKRISFVQPNTAYYINNTDASDYGTEIVSYSLTEKRQLASIKAEPNFGIDDYVVSPNGKYIVTWELQKLPGQVKLAGGKSRMYSIDVANPAQKQLLYDEVATQPIHYPRSVTNNGTVFTDMFLPNKGPGWSYGMGKSDITGRNKQQIASMANGTYGRQPRVSPDGSQFVFAGYDGSAGSGTAVVNGTRRAIAKANTVEILSAQSLTRRKLNLPNNVIYDDARFDSTGRFIFVSAIANPNKLKETKVILYDLATDTAKEIPNSSQKRGLSVLPDGKVMLAALNISSAAMGNLGETYQFVANNFEITDIATGKAETVSTADTNNQYITQAPLIGIEPSLLSEDTLEQSGEGPQMQMHTFLLMVDLLEDRAGQNCEEEGGEDGGTGGTPAITQAAPTGADAVPTFSMTPGPTVPQVNGTKTQRIAQVITFAPTQASGVTGTPNTTGTPDTGNSPGTDEECAQN